MNRSVFNAYVINPSLKTVDAILAAASTGCVEAILQSTGSGNAGFAGSHGGARGRLRRSTPQPTCGNGCGEPLNTSLPAITIHDLASAGKAWRSAEVGQAFRHRPRGGRALHRSLPPAAAGFQGSASLAIFRPGQTALRTAREMVETMAYGTLFPE